MIASTSLRSCGAGSACRVAARLAELLDDISQCRHTDAALHRQIFLPQLPDGVRQPGKLAVRHILQTVAAARQEGLRRRVRLGVHTGGVQDLPPARNTQEPGALDKGLWPQLRDLF